MNCGCPLPQAEVSHAKVAGTWRIDIQTPSSFSNSRVAHIMSPHICPGTDDPLIHREAHGFPPLLSHSTGGEPAATELKQQEIHAAVNNHPIHWNNLCFTVYGNNGRSTHARAQSVGGRIFAMLLRRQDESNNISDLILVLCW